MTDNLKSDSGAGVEEVRDTLRRFIRWDTFGRGNRATDAEAEYLISSFELNCGPLSPQRDEWITIEEGCELPCPDEWVLLTDGSSTEADYEIGFYCFKDQDFDSPESGWSNGRFTHWQPLPAPPLRSKTMGEE